MKATVIIPTHDHSALLPFSLQSALNQTVSDIEIFVIGDGVGDDTRAVMKNFLKKDARIHFFDFPKAPRNGEVHRHKVLQQAKGKVVCYLSDDDLWFPDHIETMLRLLKNADFAHAYLMRVEPDGEILKARVDLTHPYYRHNMLHGVSYVALSFGAHTRAFYHKLPHGWRTTPQGIYTDYYMWLQFLHKDSCRVASGFLPTVLNFPSSVRKNKTIEERVVELQKWSSLLGQNAFITTFRNETLQETIKDLAQANAHIQVLEKRIEDRGYTLSNKISDSIFVKYIKKLVLKKKV